MTRSHQQGFTLIETLVAISVLIVAIVVPLRVISQSLKSATFTREKITATHIAQEGLELMSAAYATNTSDVNTAWSKWGSMYSGASGFSIEPRTRAFVACTSTAENPCKLYLDTNGYTHTVTATETPYVRTMRVRTNATNPPRVEVESIVTWTNVYGVTSTSARSLWFYDTYE